MPHKNHFIRFGRSVVAFGLKNDLPRGYGGRRGKRIELHVEGLNYLYPSARSVLFRDLAEAGLDRVKIGAIKGLLSDVEKVLLNNQINTICYDFGVKRITIKGLQQKLAKISTPDLKHLEKVLSGERSEIVDKIDKGIPELKLGEEIPGAADHYYFWTLVGLQSMIDNLIYNIGENIEKRESTQ